MYALLTSLKLLVSFLVPPFPLSFHSTVLQQYLCSYSDMWSVRNLLVGWVGGVVCDLVLGLHLFVCLMVVVLGLWATVHTWYGPNLLSLLIYFMGLRIKSISM